jgi:RHS repeat-associated protein
VVSLVVLLCALRAEAVGEPVPGALSPQTLRLPDGPGSVRGLADSPTVNVFSAQVSYSIPIELPQAAGGFSPQLALSYSGDLGNGPLGIGWTLSPACIQRSLRLGVPTYTDKDELELVGVPGGGRLVKLVDGTWRVEGTGHSTKVETDGAGFAVTLSGGIRLRLGVGAQARQEDGTRTALWCVEEVVHPTGQSILYSYLKDSGQLYPSEMNWGPSSAFRVQLVYVPRTDKAVSFRSGFRVDTALRLDEVRVESFTELLRVYQLFYDNTFPVSRLQRVRMLGRGRAGALPEVSFSYATPNEAAVQRLQSLDSWALNLSGVSLADVDGDGINDLLKMDTGGHSFKRGLTTGFATARTLTNTQGTTLSTARLMDVDGDTRPEFVRVSSNEWYAYRLAGTAWQSMGRISGSLGVGLFESALSPADLNGDGRVDLVRNGSSGLLVKWGGPPTSTTLAASFSDWQSKPLVGGALSIGGAVRLQEVNGDGLMDVVALFSSYYDIYLGKGDGTFVKSGTYSYPWGGSSGAMEDLRFGDLNRDGLMDLVRVLSGTVHWYAGLPQGGVRNTAKEVLRPTPSGTSVVMALADLNGNGSDEVVWSTTGGMWMLDMAGPTSAGMLVGIDNGLGKSVSLTYEGSAALALGAEQAGSPWQSLLPMAIPVPGSMTTLPGADGPSRRVEYAVRDGLWDGKERRFGGFRVGIVRTLGATAAETLHEETHFHPGLGEERALRGMPVEVLTRSGTGQVYSTTFNTWQARDVSGMTANVPQEAPLLRKAALVQTRTQHVQGLATPADTLTTYGFDARVRPIEERHFGRLDLPGDEKVVRRVWTHDDTTWVQDAVCEETLLAAEQVLDTNGQPALQVAAQPTSQTRTFYGDATTLLAWTDPANCLPGRGLVRQVLGRLDENGTTRWVTQSEKTYDALDNPLDIYEDGVWRHLSYDPHKLHVESESTQPEVGRTISWQMQWDNVLGQPLRLTDPNGDYTEVTYDPLGRLETVASNGAAPHLRYVYDWTAPRPRVLTYSFDGAPNTLAGSWTGGWQAGGKWRESAAIFNGAGETLYSALRLGSSQWIVSDWQEHNERGQVGFVADSFYWNDLLLPTSRPATAVGQQFSYDARGRLLQQSLPTGVTKTLAYTAFDTTATTPGLAAVTTRFDGHGRILRTERTVETRLESVTASYDAAGQIVRMCLNAQPGVACDTAYTGVSHGFTYDTLGRLIAASDPDIGSRTLIYNDGGQLTHHTNGQSQTRQYFYDAAGRLTRTLGEDGTAFVYHYDEPRNGATGLRTLGNVAWVEEPRGEVHFTYDAFGRTTHLRRRVDTVWAEESTGYSPSGLPLFSEVDGVRVDTHYDAAARPVRVGRYWESLEMDASSRIVSERFGNGLTQAYDRDGLGLTKRVQVLRPTGPALYDVGVLRTAWGAPYQVEDLDGSGLNHSSLFTYDGAARLTDMVLGAVKSGSDLVEGPDSFRFTYRYDSLQNMTLRQATGPKALGILTGTYVYGGQGFGPRQLARIQGSTSDTHLSYDGAGRVTAMGGRIFQYNGLDQLVQVTLPAEGSQPAAIVRHAYGYDGQRTLTEAPDGSRQYWFTPVLSERDGKRERYLKLGDRTLARLTQTLPAAATTAAGTPPEHASVQLHEGARNVLGGLAVLGTFLVLFAAARSADRRMGSRRLTAGILLLAMFSSSCGLDGGSPALSSRWDAVVTESETLYFHMGVSPGPVVLTREDATVFEERRFEPFGEPVDAFMEVPGAPAQVGAVNLHAEPLNSLNKQTDPSTGFSYHGARWLAPQMASWLTPDPPVKAPAPEFLAEPWDLHPYQYVRQNPVLFWDPDGNAAHIAAGAGAGALVGGGIYLVKSAITGEFSWRGLGGSMLQGAITGGVAAATGGTSLLVQAGAGAAANVVGGVVSRGVETGSLSAATDTKAMLIDGAIGGLAAPVGAGIGKVVQKLRGAPAGAAARCGAGGCGGSSCFVAGTPVLTADGLKPIEEVAEGDWVWARSDKTGDEGWKRVLRTTVSPDKAVLKVRLRSSQGAEEEIRATPEHPFWVEGKGWTEAGELTAGDRVPSARGGWLQVEELTPETATQTVYNFEVDDFHTYFVGHQGAWVHNNDPCFPVLVAGASTISRKVHVFSTTPGWGLTPQHLDKHFFGNTSFALKNIDPGGNGAKWTAHMVELFNSAVTRRTTNGMLDIIKTFPRADGSGTFKMGVRLFERPDKTFDLITVLTKQ